MDLLKTPEDVVGYEIAGSVTTTLILLPGMGDLRSSWRHVVPGLVAAGLRVVSVDLRGHGDSGTAFTSFGPRACASDVLSLIEALGAGPTVVVGNSAAAGTAVWASLDAPDRISGIALVGPVVRAAPPWWMRLLMGLLFRPWWGARAWGAFYRSLFKGGAPADHEAHVAEVVAGLADPRRRAAMLENGVTQKPGDRLGDVRVPTLVVMGTADPDFPDAAVEARAIAAATRGTLVLFDGVGHYPHQERPDALVHALVTFVRSACPAPV